MRELFDEFLLQLVAKGYRLAVGTLIDASLVAAPVQRQLGKSAASDKSVESAATEEIECKPEVPPESAPSVFKQA